VSSGVVRRNAVHRFINFKGFTDAEVDLFQPMTRGLTSPERPRYRPLGDPGVA
jgi:hypothetical protein